MTKKQMEILVLVLGILAVFFAFSMKRAPNAPQASACPHLLAEDSQVSVTLEDCHIDPVLPAGNYVASALVLKRKSDGDQRRYPGQFAFSSDASAAISPSISVSPDGQYLFLKQGTSVVQGLSVFALSGTPRFTTLEYVAGESNPILTGNGYLVYQSRSAKYPKAHPEVEMAAALDVQALRLSDFADKVVYAGTPTTDYTLGADAAADEKILSVTKIDWKDPAKISAGQTKTQVSLPISDLEK